LGRVVVIKFSVLMIVLAMLSYTMVVSPFSLLVASGFLGFATGIASPAVFAWTIDLSPENSLGRSLATVYIALEIGIGGGALISAWLYDNDAANFPMAFMVAAGIIAIAGVYLQFIYKEKTS